MKNLYTKIFFCCLLLHMGQIHSMLRLLKREPSRSATIQKRTIGSYQNIVKASKRLLPHSFEHCSLINGVTLAESHILSNFLRNTPITPTLAVTHQLFHKINPEERPFPSNRIPLSPNFIGQMVGDLEKKGKIEEQNYDITNKLARNINEAYKVDKNRVYALLTAFAYMKSNPDMQSVQEYYEGLNSKLSFTTPHCSIAENLQRESNSYSFDKSNNNFKQAIDAINDPRGKIEFAKNNFTDAVGCMVHNKIKSSRFIPRIISGKHGYQGQKEVTTCAEATIRTALYALTHNKGSQSLDLSLLPHSIKPTDSIQKFYQEFNSIDTINTHQAGQAFIDMVSGLPELHYVKSNYELKSKHMPSNLIKLCNHFFGINANEINDLGEKFSDSRRTVTFNLEPHQKGNKIAITIVDHEKNEENTVNMCFNDHHSWIEAHGTDPKNNFFNAEVLFADYKDPKSRSLFELDVYPTIPRSLFTKKQNGLLLPSMHYAGPVVNGYEKIGTVLDIMNYDKSPESIAYAQGLFKQLDTKEQLELAPYMVQ